MTLQQWGFLGVASQPKTSPLGMTLDRENFICGDAKALFQNCLIKAHIPLAMQYNTIIAQKRAFEKDATRIVLQNCTIKASRDLEKMDNITTYLGRPWGILSRTMIIESYIDHLISPRG
ncbi:hypothetical protein KY290_029790 [Solanum tuberosum]|uniref:Pectinesterase catalytic domain-containing protein n=1 Tax=Solanum tuberosum TaxID=4113 RepID=A0ABQ7ULQ7_SOLTU|nr:hypothetical protein KY289_029012 [Solanum tuberosum]KAH0663912.1 hypothetical protein KY284_028843 [Solanum tuberosum]KAH0667629.1 hypothetical protein KY285_028835 [Solanum tuberosum]KAH0750558.1 hypothetical protein KY290_029790 [Solanum tuberosum]